MAVGWNKEQAARVLGAMAAHPLTSARCEHCAIEIRVVGLEVDPETHCLSVRPVGREPCLKVNPKADLHGEWWYYHFTTNVSAHCVDVLTLVPGTEVTRYLDTHWKYPDALEMTREEPVDD